MHRAIRTLYVLPSGADGPESQLLWHLLSHLPREAVEPAVCFLEDGPLVQRWTGALRLRAQALAAAGKRTGPGRAARAMAGVVRQVGAQLVHAVGQEAQLAAGRAARATGVPDLWTQSGLARWGRLADVRAALSNARAILVHSAAGEKAQRRMNLYRRACRRLEPGVTLPERLPEHRRRDARAALHVRDDALLAASIGPLDDPAPHERFLLAGASLCHARARAHLLIAGSRGVRGKDNALTRRIAELGLADRTSYADAAHLQRAFDACDLVFQSAVGEPVLPVALLEALAAGVAVVVEPSPLVSEIVIPETTAVIAPEDHEALAVILLALADHPERRAELATAAARAARERHDAERMADGVLALYRELLPA